MNKFLAFFYCITFATFGQSKGEINLDKNITLQWEIQNFDKTKHSFEYCMQSNWKYICKIDNQEWFGSDYGMEFPKNELTNLTLIIEKQNINLEVTKMFNPNFSGFLSKNQLKIVKKNEVYFLYSFFSDGAGSYSAHWKIEKGKAERIVLSNEEKYFEWQLE